jgi:alginate O-acetyltransferase complex protein AlgI
MLFTTPRFFLFLIVVLLLFYGAPRAWRKWILLVASYYFYASWDVRFVPLLLGLTCVDYWAGLLITRCQGQRRKFAYIAGLVANLGCLGFFKYYNFFAAGLVDLLGLQNSLALKILLPVGISFVTFQGISYIIDVYRGDEEAIHSLLDFSLYIAFFSKLVAGPIVRARGFFRDLLKWRQPDSDDLLRGVLLIVFGVAKKLVVADQFALVADRYFNHVAANPGALTAWCGAIAFGLQVYFDFSGYTDIAIGTAQLFGFHFPANFRRPYLSLSITDFWRRWHITLSNWFRDYVYFSLPGLRSKWKIFTYIDLTITMLLCGLWHGASWTFIVWGGYHGLLMSLEHFSGFNQTHKVSGYAYPLRVAFTFGLVSIGWVFFRSPTLALSFQVIGQMFSRAPGTLLFEQWHLYLIALTLVLAILEEKWGWFEKLVRAPAFAYAAAVALLLLSIELLGVTGTNVPFVYFQF